jgi:RNA-binding protein
MPSNPLRRRLRGLGHALPPVVQIGKQGPTASVVTQIAHALLDHELIKVRLGAECPETRFEIAELLGEESGVNVVQILGRTVLLYKRHPKKPKIEPAKKRPESRPPLAAARRRPESRPPRR